MIAPKIVVADYSVDIAFEYIEDPENSSSFFINGVSVGQWSESFNSSTTGLTPFLIPEKIHGKFAVLHGITPHILIEYVPDIQKLKKYNINLIEYKDVPTPGSDDYIRMFSRTEDYKENLKLDKSSNLLNSLYSIFRFYKQ